MKLDRVDAPSLIFSTTNQLSTNLDNIGNQPLPFPVPMTGNNPSIAPNFTYNSGAPSACPLLTPASSTAGICPPATPAYFPSTSLPPNGSITGTLVVTDNSLNAPAPAYLQQSIPLSGAYAGQGTSSSLSASPNPSIFGQSVTFTATVIADGSPVTSGTVAFNVDGSMDQQA